MKRTLSLVLALLMLVSMAIVPALAQSTTTRTKITAMMEASESSETYKMWSAMLEGYVKEAGLDIEIEYELLPNDSDYANKLQLYIASNQLPDFYGCANGTFSKAAKGIGAIVNIGEELKRLGAYDQMNSAIVNFLTDSDDGQLYLMPNALYCEYFMYRKDKFEQYGLTAPETWDQFMEACRVLKENGETPVVIGGADQWQIMRYLSFGPWRATHDGFIMGYINQTDSFAKNESAQNAVNMVYDMGKNGYFQDGFTGNSYSDAADMFFGGEGCIFYSGSGHIGMASQMYADGKLGVFPVPAVDGMDNISTNVPIHAGFANALNAQTYDEVMQGFLEYVVKHQHEVTLANNLFSPWNYELPQGLDPLFYDVLPLFKTATDSWVSWDDKLDAATVVAMEDAQEELALNMITPDEFITEMDKVVAENNPK